jgi:hypothetical protein
LAPESPKKPLFTLKQRKNFDKYSARKDDGAANYYETISVGESYLKDPIPIIQHSNVKTQTAQIEEKVTTVTNQTDGTQTLVNQFEDIETQTQNIE